MSDYCKIMYLFKCLLCIVLFFVGNSHEEVYTFINNSNVICVATKSDINSTIYLLPVANNSKLTNKDDLFCGKEGKIIKCSKNSKKQDTVSDLLSLWGSEDKWLKEDGSLENITDRRWENLRVQKSAPKFSKLPVIISVYNTTKPIELSWCKNKTIQGNWTHCQVDKTPSHDISEKILYKEHKSNFFKATEPSVNNVSAEIEYNGHLTVSMYYRLASNSKLVVEIGDQNKHLECKKPQKWEYFYFNVTSKNYTRISIHRTTDNNTNGYWAIADLRFFTENKRMLQSSLIRNSKFPTCETLTSDSSQLLTNTTQCTEFFGNNPYCKNYITCSKLSGKLYCEKCSKSKKKQCKKFEKIYFKKPPVLLKPPLLENITDNEVTINTTNLKHDSYGVTPDEYLIQYKQENEQEFTNYSFCNATVQSVTISGLNTTHFKYKIRILLGLNQTFVNTSVPELTVEKRCLKIKNVTDSSITVECSSINSDFQNYAIKYQFSRKSIKKGIRLEKNYILISNLNSSTNYSIYLYKGKFLIDHIDAVTNKTPSINSEKKIIIPSFVAKNSKIRKKTKDKPSTESTRSETTAQKSPQFDIVNDKKLKITFSYGNSTKIILYITEMEEQKKTIPKKSKKLCETPCECKISLDGETHYNMEIENIQCENEKWNLSITIRKFEDLSENSVIQICFNKSDCTLFVPLPNHSNKSNFELLIEHSKNYSTYRNVTNLKVKDNYFEIKINATGAVFLKNTSYIMTILDKSNNNKYILYRRPLQEETIVMKKTAFITFIVLSVLAFFLLIYLSFAYKYRLFPFELRKQRFQTNSENITVQELSETYIQCKIKTIRPKIQDPECGALLEMTQSEQNYLSSFPVKLDKFEEYVDHSIRDDPYNNDLTLQYQKIQLTFDKPRTVGSLPHNLTKNRYKNLVPYDHSRVKLQDSENDYINASYIDGYKSPKAFIATQAPLPSTTHDFWSMIWQHKVEYIIMLTDLIENGIVKCEKYWPDNEKKSRFGEILIETIKENLFSDFVYRTLKVDYDGESRLIYHLQYTTWPDHGVPLYSQNFTSFIKQILKIPQTNAPIVVHCNAGIGRTGTLIMCDFVLRMAANEKVLDFVKVLTKIREQRSNLVNNVNQYVFAHLVVTECLFGVDFSIPINDSFQDELHKILRKTTIKPVIEQLDKITEQLKKRQMLYTCTLSKNDKKKNRFSQILPGPTQVYVPSIASQYINAIFVDCYRCPKKFIVTQQPLPNTLQDFWSMVKDYTVNTIVSLNEIDDKDPNCPKFWEWKNHKLQEEIDERAYKLIKLKTNIDSENAKTVNIISVKNWKRDTWNPPNIKHLILTYKEMFETSWKGSSQIVITCYDGATACGLFVALVYLLEKINYEQVCDVFSAIRTVRQFREQFVQEWGQVEILYKAAKIYIEEFENYDNFTN